MHEPLVPFLVSAIAALLLLIPSCCGKVMTNANPLTRGLELPLYTRNFVLTCNNSADTKVDHWEKDNVELRSEDEAQLGLRVAQDRSSLTIDNTRRHHEGNYTCVFTNDEKGHFTVKARPEPVLQSEHFVPGTSSLNMVEGASLRLVCKSKMNESVNVRWQMQPEDMSDDPLDVTFSPAQNVFQTAPDDGISAAILNIISVRYTDRAFYICRVDNGVASSDLTLLIRVKDKLAALWPFLAIVGEVLILCVVIFIYEKRRPKAEMEEEVTSKPSSPAKGAPDVRQRK